MCELREKSYLYYVFARRHQRRSGARSDAVSPFRCPPARRPRLPPAWLAPAAVEHPHGGCVPPVQQCRLQPCSQKNRSCPIACQSVRLTTCVVLFDADQSDVRGGNMPMLKTKSAMTMTAERPPRRGASRPTARSRRPRSSAARTATRCAGRPRAAVLAARPRAHRPLARPLRGRVRPLAPRAHGPPARAAMEDANLHPTPAMLTPFTSSRMLNA